MPPPTRGSRTKVIASSRASRPRLCKRAPIGSDTNSVRSVSQDTVFAVPELLSLITVYLDKNDLRALIRVCRAWNAFWVPYLYSELFFYKYKRSRVYPKLGTYGIHFGEVIAAVPQLRSLSLTLDKTSYKTHGWPLVLTSALPDLEEFAWTGDTTLHFRDTITIEEILHVLKSCTKLRSLRLARLAIVESCFDPPNELSDGRWQSRSLQRLECDYVFFDPHQSYPGANGQTHPCVRRLFERAPNLRIVKVTGRSNLCPLDWSTVFSRGANVEHVELSVAPYTNDPIDVKDALPVLGTSCSHLKVINTNRAQGTTDQHFAPILRANRQLQRLCVKETAFGDTSLGELTEHRIVALDLEGCRQVTSAGVLSVLENCRFLQDLNLAGTRAGTLELFNGSRPWACVKSLQILHVDIQPIGFLPPLLYSGWSLNEAPHTAAYSPAEQRIIHDRLCSLTSLTHLELRGESMERGIFKDASFTPRLRSALIGLPFECGEEMELSVRERLVQQEALETGRKMFPDWLVSLRRLYYGKRMCCIFSAVKRDDPRH
ncbi:hypothetical protein EC968_009493 [Mortierella alpina]|nr:hypothetical protein EC968_009493 [Mortierella alpina]